MDKNPYRCVYIDWRSLRGTWRHEKLHWRGHIHETWSVAQKIIGVKVKDINFHWGGDSWFEWVYSLQFMANKFLYGQGYGIMNNIVNQYNQSTITMEKNGRNSCTGNSIHINIRYFFVKAIVYKGVVKIDYCPTQMMLADYFENPLKGKVFKIFRNVIMGYKLILSLESIPVLIKYFVRNNG